MLAVILLVLAAVCFGAAASNKVAARFNLVALGLFFAILVPLIAAARGL